MRHCAAQKYDPSGGSANFVGRLGVVGCTNIQVSGPSEPHREESSLEQTNSGRKERQQTTPPTAPVASEALLLSAEKTPAATGTPTLLRVPQVTIRTPTSLASSPATPVPVRKMSFTDLYGLLRKRPKLTLKLHATRTSYTGAQVSTPAAETPAGAGASSDANTSESAGGAPNACCASYGRRFTFKPKGSFMLMWLGVVSLAVLYNIWTTIAREAFRNIVEGYLVVWLLCDALADLIYVLDIVVQSCTGFYEKACS